MKSYTDLEQSKKLAEFLPLESADMCWCTRKLQWGEIKETIMAYPILPNQEKSGDFKYIPAWSLAALLEHLRKHNLFPEIKDAGDCILIDITFYDDEVVRKVINPIHFIRIEGKNILDACYELILKLNELKML